MPSISCGNHGVLGNDEPVKHSSVEAVRRCHAAETWSCTWLIEIPAGYDAQVEDWVDAHVRECGGLSWYLEDGRGYECEYGHDHVYDEIRAQEGWDYAADPEEAGLLAGRGVHPVAMDGTAIEIDPGAMRYAMGL